MRQDTQVWYTQPLFELLESEYLNMKYIRHYIILSEVILVELVNCEHLK